MSDEQEHHEMYEHIFEAMLYAKWLKRVVETQEKGFHPVWFPEGKAKIQVLKIIADTHGLSRDDRSPLAFDILARGGNPGCLAVGKLEPDDAEIWITCIDELGLAGDAAALLTLVTIALAWGGGPLPDSPLD